MANEHIVLLTRLSVRPGPGACAGLVAAFDDASSRACVPIIGAMFPRGDSDGIMDFDHPDIGIVGCDASNHVPVRFCPYCGTELERLYG